MVLLPKKDPLSPPKPIHNKKSEWRYSLKVTCYRRPKPTQNKKGEWCCSLKVTCYRRPKPTQNK